MGKAKYWGSELVVKPKKKPKPKYGLGAPITNNYLNGLRQDLGRPTTRGDFNAPPVTRQQYVAYTWENVYRNNFIHNNAAVGFYEFLNLIVKAFITEPNSPITVDDIVFRLGDKLSVIRIHYNKTLTTFRAALEVTIIQRKMFLQETYGEVRTEEELMEREEEQARLLDDDIDDEDEDDPDTNF